MKAPWLVLHLLVVKSELLCVEPPQWKGGALQALSKGKGGHNARNSYRVYLLTADNEG